MSSTYYISTRNALKRSDASGTANMAAPTTAAYSGLYVTNMTVSHGLGFAPVFRFYCEPFGDGIIWPSLGDRTQGYAANPNNLVQRGPGILAWADTTAPYDIHIQLFYNTNALTGTYPVYWVIYKDFGL